jgi:hypothetical protein
MYWWRSTHTYRIHTSCIMVPEVKESKYKSTDENVDTSDLLRNYAGWSVISWYNLHQVGFCAPSAQTPFTYIYSRQMHLTCILYIFIHFMCLISKYIYDSCRHLNFMNPSSERSLLGAPTSLFIVNVLMT